MDKLETTERSLCLAEIVWQTQVRVNKELVVKGNANYIQLQMQRIKTFGRFREIGYQLRDHMIGQKHDYF